MLKRAGPLFVVLIACIWLNQSYGLLKWVQVRDVVFADPRSHLFDAARYPFIFLYRRSTDEAMYYGTAAQILGEPYETDIVATHRRGRVDAALGYGVAPPHADGHWHMPWSEVPLEYTALVLPFMLLPKILTQTFESFAKVFGVMMGLCIAASIALAVDVVRVANLAGKQPSRLDGRWWLGAGLLLAQGALTIQRLDPIVALLMIGMLHGAVRRRPGELGACAGLAAGCKILPLLVVPVLIAADPPFWRARGRRISTWIAGGIAAGFGPMLLVSWTAIENLFRYHAMRGLQIESTLAVLVSAVRLVLGTSRPAEASYGSCNLDGAVPDSLARLTLPLTLAGIVALALVVRRADEPRDELERIERITWAALAATIVLWLGGKVFSPQYLTWGIPLVLAIPESRGVKATWMAILAMVLTQVFFRGFYDKVVAQEFVGVATVLARQGVLVVLLLYAMRSLRAQAADEKPAAVRLLEEN